MTLSSPLTSLIWCHVIKQAYVAVYLLSMTLPLRLALGLASRHNRKIKASSIYNFLQPRPSSLAYTWSFLLPYIMSPSLLSTQLCVFVTHIKCLFTHLTYTNTCCNTLQTLVYTHASIEGHSSCDKVIRRRLVEYFYGQLGFFPGPP
jgi:hypothetical protein